MRPPFEITPEVERLCAAIERALGRAEGLGGATPAPLLRRKNKVRTVHATAAIEGNRLSLEQVTAVLDGKRVAGPPTEIAEVRNACEAYDLVSRFDPLSETDFLRAHRVLMSGLHREGGRYRSGNVGVLAGSRVKHVAPQAKRVPELMRQLFAFLHKDLASPLVKACVFHYEVEFIHPFSDGNGRAGRLWQHAILHAYSPVFAHVPTESLIKKHQRAYYAALARADRTGAVTPFLVFMLQQLRAALEQFAAECTPARGDGGTRLTLAAAHFGSKPFSRKEYRALHPQLSAPTASRDLHAGVQEKRLSMRGDKATARYVFARKSRKG